MNILVTPLQVENKVKFFKRTYKQIKIHNETSGKDRKNWRYFENMDQILRKRPEKTPRGTCADISDICVTDVPSTSGDGKENTVTEKSPESSFSAKRKKRLSDVERRHQDKMARLDRFNDLFERMLDKK